MVLELADVKILVLEDQSSIRGLLVNSLSTLGIGEVICASSVSEAIECIKACYEEQKDFGKGAVSAVLLDIVLEDPKLTGLDLAEWIRSNPQCPTPFLPIMMFSALATLNMVQRSRSLGVNVFMRKPFAVDNLSSLLIGLLRDQRSFIKTEDYFGPDRRRRNPTKTFDGEDRRGRDSTKKSDVMVYKRASVSRSDYVLKEENVAKAEEVFQKTIDAAVDNLNEHIKQVNAHYNIFAGAVDEFQKLKTQNPDAAEKKQSEITTLANKFLDSMIIIRLDMGVFRVPILSEIAQNLSEFVCEIVSDPIRAMNRDAIALIDKFIRFMIVVMRNIDGIDKSTAKEITSELRRACQRFQRKYILFPISQALLEQRIRSSMDRLQEGHLSSELG